MFGHPRERFGAALLIAAVLLAACGSGSTSPTSSPTSSQTPASGAASPAPSATSDESACAAGDTTAGFQHQLCEIDAPSLAGNLLGDRAVVQVSILVPVDYATSGKRYPVVYSLAGFNTVGETLAGNLLRSLDSSAGAGQVILVFTGGFNALGGSFYVNSSVTGNWEDAIANDLVSYVDAHFRTVAKPAAPGIAGHSMGGFGAVSVGMHRADVFGAIYAMSPGLFDANGAQARLGDPDVIDAVLGSQAALSSATPSNAAAAFYRSDAPSTGRQLPGRERPSAVLRASRLHDGRLARVRDRTLTVQPDSGLATPETTGDSRDYRRSAASSRPRSLLSRSGRSRTNRSIAPRT
ncbi:MAG TPA: alpha/beta hydrolase-fold protein [Candidatus Limnocylindrales bacterium]